MDSGLELSAVPATERRASVLDVALLWAGANVVSSTLVTGATLGAAFSFSWSLGLILVGGLGGALLIAGLARLGPRYGLPSMVVLRHPFGTAGAAVISGALILTNFAWIAFNNIVAADALTTALGGSTHGWNVAVAAVAIAVALYGPRAMALFDRFAVPIMILVGLGLTYVLLGSGRQAVLASRGDGSLSLLAGFDLVVGYQVSWSLMFADYTRYQRRERKASLAVLLGLGASGSWLMTVGAGAGAVGGGNDPTAMILGLGLPGAALVLVALSTVTTNFVNLYLSSLALKNLWPRLGGTLTVVGIGLVGTAFGLVRGDLLEAYGRFMGLIATLLLPIVAIVTIHFFVPGGRRIDDPTRAPVWRGSAALAWGAGAVVYRLLEGSAVGATVPCLVVTAAIYGLAHRMEET